MRKLNEKSVVKPHHPVRLLQFGEGNFLRAFVDWMLDISNEKGVTDASVAVVSPRFRENDGIRRLREQDCLYHVWLEGIQGGEVKSVPRLVTSVADAFSPASDFGRYESYILSPDLRFVVSNTTEAGIVYAEDDIFSETPATFPGKVASMLYRRYLHFGGDRSRGLIFLCCELIEDNGSRLKEFVMRHARAASLEQEFLDWIEDACIFCDTLVDRIVPGYPADTIGEIQKELDFEDSMVVKGELYHVWAIGGRDYEKVRRELPLDKAGLNVLFLPSVKSFRDKKVRILNGSHTGMVPIALQLGCETVLEAFGDSMVNEFVTSMVEREVLPTIDEDPVELKHFADGILERFYNPYIRHMLRSISLNSLSKWEARNFPTVRDLWTRQGRLADFALFSFAALMALYSPASGFTPDDNACHIATLRKAWEQHPADYEAVVRQILDDGVFSENFEAVVPDFAAGVAKHLKAIVEEGMRKALAGFLKEHNPGQA